MRTGAWVQLRGLFGLRWQMIRSTRTRVAALVTLAVVLWLIVVVARGTGALDDAQLAAAVDVAPQAFLGFGLLAVIAPLTAGGGNEIFPPDQLVAYPVRPRTQLLGGLLLAPVNLVWVIQILALVAETAVLTDGGAAVAAAIVTGLYVVALTVLGQALAWLVVGLRQTHRGRQVVATAGAAVLVAAVVIVKAGLGDAALHASPTRSVVAGVVAGTQAQGQRWGLTVLVLVALATLGWLLGERSCGWALRRPADSGAARESRVVRRRPAHRSSLRTLVAMDRASVWRAPALRRGALVLGVLPGLAAVGAAFPWESLIVMPGLVAAGAGLLFGINAFCLDGSGAVFLASLPHDPRLLARAKALVLAETVLGAVTIAAVAGALRSPGTPTSAEAVAITVSGLTCTLVVVALGIGGSVRRPHKADLKGPRDAVAPPGALTMASVRLVAPTALIGFLLGAAAKNGVWWQPLVVALPFVAVAAWSLQRSFARWADPLLRSRVVQTVASG